MGKSSAATIASALAALIVGVAGTLVVTSTGSTKTGRTDAGELVIPDDAVVIINRSTGVSGPLAAGKQADALLAEGGRLLGQEPKAVRRVTVFECQACESGWGLEALTDKEHASGPLAPGLLDPPAAGKQ